MPAAQVQAGCTDAASAQFHVWSSVAAPLPGLAWRLRQARQLEAVKRLCHSLRIGSYLLQFALRNTGRRQS